MTVRIYWFRNDLRLLDNQAFSRACRASSALLPVYCHEPVTTTRWGFERSGPHRRHFLAATLGDLTARLRERGSDLFELAGRPAQVLPALARAVGAQALACEEIAAPEEQQAVSALRAAGLPVETTWLSSLLDPATLPFPPASLPEVFTAFRLAVERDGSRPPEPLPVPARVPGLPALPEAALRHRAPPGPVPKTIALADSSFPYALPSFAGGETAALSHLERYLGRRLAHTYKSTRNELAGVDFSSKLSPWLASGALSARTVYAALKGFEAQHGANDGTYWLWFELLFRDYFRFLHLKHGSRLYRARGLGEAAAPAHDAQAFMQWAQGRTTAPLINAGMRELAATGYLSNRMRQILASYLVYDLGGDFRAGAAWFESMLVDYDVYINQGNWLSIAGRGTDPRGGRRFNLRKQEAQYDPGGQYQARWGP